MTGAGEEPSYLAFARANVRGRDYTSPQIVESLLARIDRDAARLEEAANAVTAAKDGAWHEGYEACRAGKQRHSPYKQQRNPRT